MKYRTLGRTNLKVAEVGIGTWQLTNDEDMWVGGDLEESMRALHKYTELGGNFIDTAWVYGYSASNPKQVPAEVLIGNFLKETGIRDQVVIASKVLPKNWKWPALKNISIDEVFPAEHIEQIVDESLKRLGVDTLDLMQFHVWQDDWAELDEWKQTIQKITQAGKVKFWGISANDYQPTNCLKSLDTGLLNTVQFIFNIFHQKPTEKLFPYAKENNIGLIARVPFDEGSLTGKFTKETKFEAGDFRNDYFGGNRLIETVNKVDDLKSLLGSEAKSMAELALRYILSFEEISAVIPGMRKVSYVEEGTSVSDGKKLSESLLNKLKDHAWERNFYSGLDPWLQESGYVEA